VAVGEQKPTAAEVVAEEVVVAQLKCRRALPRQLEGLAQAPRTSHKIFLELRPRS